MKISKIVAIIMCTVLTLSCVCTQVFASNITISAGNAKTNASGDVELPVSISGNTGITSVELTVDYDSSKLDFVSGKSSMFSTMLAEENGGYVACSGFVSEAITADGDIVVLTFKAKDTSQNTTVDITVNVKNVANGVDELSDIKTANGSITIGTASSPTTETTTKTVVTETKTEATTKAVVTEATTKTTVDASTEATTKAVIESSTAATTKATEVTTSRRTTTTVDEDDEEYTEETTRSGKSSSKASVKVDRVTTEEQTEATTKATVEPVATGSVSVVIGQNKITVNGSQKAMDAVAYIQPSSNSTMVPLRFVSEAVAGVKGYGAIVDWNGTTKTATITYGENVLTFTSGKNIMTVNGKTIYMENNVCAEIVDGRMYIPFRALGNALDVNVDWDADTKTAVYSVE